MIELGFLNGRERLAGFETPKRIVVMDGGVVQPHHQGAVLPDEAAVLSLCQRRGHAEPEALPGGAPHQLPDRLVLPLFAVPGKGVRLSRKRGGGCWRGDRTGFRTL